LPKDAKASRCIKNSPERSDDDQSLLVTKKMRKIKDLREFLKLKQRY